MKKKCIFSISIYNYIQWIHYDIFIHVCNVLQSYWFHPISASVSSVYTSFIRVFFTEPWMNVCLEKSMCTLPRLYLSPIKTKQKTKPFFNKNWIFTKRLGSQGQVCHEFKCNLTYPVEFQTSEGNIINPSLSTLYPLPTKTKQVIVSV